MSHLFSYSTLRLPQVMRKVLGRDPPHVKAQVQGHVVDYGNDYKDLKPGHDIVNGEVYQVSQEELEKLSRWEKDYHLEMTRTISDEPVLYFKMRFGNIHHFMKGDNNASN